MTDESNNHNSHYVSHQNLDLFKQPIYLDIFYLRLCHV